MDEKIIKPEGLFEFLLYPYFIVKNYFSGSAIAGEIKSKLLSQKQNNRGSNGPIPEGPGAGVTGACEIVIPGVGFECEKGLTERQCRTIILEAQETNRGIWGKFRPGGQCSM